jgi:hypothetical protein
MENVSPHCEGALLNGAAFLHWRHDAE